MISPYRGDKILKEGMQIGQMDLLVWDNDREIDRLMARVGSAEDIYEKTD
jgi:hypothetical protein